MADFALPDLGEGVAEAEIDRWLVEEGQQIGEDDPLVEVITDKATAEIPSPFAGVVSRIHVQSGQVVPVGTVLVTIGEPTAVSEDGASGAETALMSEPQSANDPETSADRGRETESPQTGGLAMPPIRRLARELDVDLTTVTGSGPGGRILREDVEAAAGALAPTASEPASGSQRVPTGSEPASAGGRREPFRGVRRRIAERMLEAHLAVPPVTHVEECDVTELDATRRLANDRSPDEVHLTFLPFIVKAVVQGLKDHPALNASLDEAAGEIVFHDHYDIGIAVDAPAGLVVPVIKDADKKRLRAIASEIERLSAAARDGSLSNADISNGTFTVTSPGPFGGLMATPIVLHPQSAILGVHRAGDRAVVRDGQIVIRKMMNMSVTFDHRILDGMTAARFILDVVKLLEHPAVLALEA
ncbi:MAG TPA: dihydrolipoamide acetyltransferase family protein [Actinomycetota bacterium]|jgi:pyruvate dehydrogenase E2 component (dihydrolipoamide acetyltransferase)|nr:dihydrolipoamide acetyltransferase family protein [Actinomycetota bacterium]